MEDDIVRRDSVHAIVNALSDPHYAALRALILHLNRVQHRSQRNQMTASNLALIFGPTLTGVGAHNLADVGWQVRLVETLLLNATDIFDED
ncbi:RhoGAP-domain-containing protein [Aspergillus steynii IBT 23096]|uniref:RhoGAP-domain-containing protein n=1 Tax=Aspergillus steynii IBT 23096 TaxID=1392250 RepID=A0A2I2G9W7_9EURO|nr:RhoGAP-domain-containing protein [Aspergillus steynii IBT 23096]PLB49672.1 RhoGAP-domain-containing protein [Aspergillus steynii IBT 23096]